jgi:uncharacterized protein (TIGR00255 family)
MTGYNSLTAPLKLHDGQTCALSIELKSINGRFFEVICKLPSTMNHMEINIISVLQKKLLRGRIFLTIRFDGGNDILETIIPSLKVAQGYLTAAEHIKAHANLPGAISITDLMQLPNVFTSEKGSLHAADEAAIMALVTKAADNLTATRIEEGKALERDLAGVFNTCEQRIGSIETLFESIMSEKKEETKHYLVPAQEGDETAKDRLDELYATLNKIDIHEEITRFKSHLANVKHYFGINQVDKGKRLDFILQELLREVNTLMAKSSHFDISSMGIDIKVELEKAREQVQNII